MRKCKPKQIPVYTPLGERTFVCQYCRKEFVSRYKKKYCCFEHCAKANTHTRTKTKITTANSLSLAQINKLAREQGLTYGQYMQKIYAEELKTIDN